MNRSSAFLLPLLVLLLSGCGGNATPPPAPLDAQLDVYTNSANLEFQNDNLTSAAADFAKALDRARIIDDPTSVADAAFNLAICRAALADYPEALLLLQEAQRESDRAHLSTTNLVLAEARVQLLVKEAARAKNLSTRVLTEKRLQASEDQKLQAYLIRGSANLALDDVPSANQDLSAAQAISGSANQPGLANLQGEIHLRSDDYPAAAADFDRQASLDRQAHQYRDMIRALTKAGRAFLAAGQPGPAADRLYRSARAATARSDTEAPALIKEALSAARQANDPGLINLINALMPAPTTMP